MKNHSEKAVELFLSGRNCAQSVLCAYADELGIDFETLLKISSSFGGGMGRLREVCGGVSAMFMVAGLKRGYTTLNDEDKEKHYTLIQELGHKFQEEHGSIVCRELLNLLEHESSPKPTKRTENFYKERPCAKFIESACKILDETII